MKLNKSIKIGRHKYRVQRPRRRLSLNAVTCLCQIEHKGRPVVALTTGWDREFYSRDVINRTDAIRIINFLSDYINTVKPTNATALAASMKATTNRAVRVGQELSAIAVGAESAE